MATDMFGNILSPEEEERQRLHAEAMGILPPALRIQMTSPFGGGVGPQSYQGSFAIPPSVPDSLPLFSQNITPIPTDVTVDPTMAGVTQDYGPFSPHVGALTSILDPAPPPSVTIPAPLPSPFGQQEYFDDPELNEEMERMVAEDASRMVDNFGAIVGQDPVSGIGGWIKDPTLSVELPEIRDIPQRYTSPMPRLSPEDIVPQAEITPIGFTTDAGMAEVPVGHSQATAPFGGGLGLGVWTGDPQNSPATVQFESTTPTDAQIDDVMRHGGLTFGVPVDTGQFSDIMTSPFVPQHYREYVRDTHDTIGQFLGDRTDTDKLQDLINNQIAKDTLRLNPTAPRQDLFDQFVDNPNTVYSQDSLNAMVGLAKSGYYETEQQVQDAIDEVKTGVDSFKELSVPSAPTVTRPTRSIAIPAAVKSGPTHVPAQPSGPSPAEIARQEAINAQMAQEAAARQRQQQAAVAAEQARQAQAAQAAQEATRRSLESQMRNWQGRDEQDESAMAQIQAALDHIADLQGTGVTSGSGGGRIRGDRNGGAAGALGGYRGDPVGREAAIGSRGGSRNGGGRSHGGGYHGR